MVGINHVALCVGNVEDAVEFYGRIFELELRGRLPGMAFLDMGDQFLAQVGTLDSSGRGTPPM
jgi:catechol 2,3-dioxygenase-like lactoylglutathione lyase family enzyme